MVVVSGAALTLVDAGTPLPGVVPQTAALRAVVRAADEADLMTSETYTPLLLGTSEVAVVTIDTATVL